MRAGLFLGGGRLAGRMMADKIGGQGMKNQTQARRPQEEPQPRRGLIGGARSMMGNVGGFLQNENGGVSNLDRIGLAAAMMRDDPSFALAAQQGIDRQQSGYQEQQQAAAQRMQEMAGQKSAAEQERQRLDGQARALGMDPAEFSMLPSEVQSDLFARQYTPEEPDRPTSFQEHQLAQQDPAYAASLRERRGPLVSVNNNGQPQPDPFQNTLAGAEGEQFVGFMERAPSAQRNLIRIDQLEGMLGESGSGIGAAARARAADFGLEIGEGVGDLQAARALINSMVPDQRPPGSGVMSDADLELFKQSLPRLINTPEGNRQIIETMRSINQYDAQLGQIAQAAASGQMNRQQAREAVNALNNPIDRVRAYLQNTPEAPAGPVGDIPRIQNDDDFDALPSGSQYIGPDGVPRRKP